MNEKNLVLVISDIHANLTALEAVLEDARPYDEVWCLGDLVGYGPDPNEVIERIKSLPKVNCVLGNHDAAVIEKLEISAFNFDARKAILWTQSVLDTANIAFLKELPTLIEIDDFTLVHGSPRFHLWEYLIDASAAETAFAALKTKFCLVGHSHLPISFSLNSTKIIQSTVLGDNVTVYLDHYMIINPGSVGQPRDHDSRASYAILDRATNTVHRVAYDILSVQRRIHQAGLSARHAQRLSSGW